VGSELCYSIDKEIGGFLSFDDFSWVRSSLEVLGSVFCTFLSSFLLGLFISDSMVFFF
jgi:hypothetical protein